MTELQTQPYVAEQVAASLASLGEAPGEVHFELLKVGLRGVRGERCALNPVVRFLRRRLDLDCPMELLPGTPVVVLHLRGGDLRVSLPPAVASFLDRFNAGLYPQLAVQLPSLGPRST